MAIGLRMTDSDTVGMELCVNHDPRFTNWATSLRLPRELFVVVDVGVKGGEHTRWHAFGERLMVHGFDALHEAVEELKKRNSAHPNRHYHWIAAGEEDGDRELFFNGADPYASSFYRPPGHGQAREGAVQDEIRRVPVRRLDGLLDAGLFPQPDVLKVDVEGYEKQVLGGARKLIRSGLLALESETNLNASPEYPRTHLGAVLEFANEGGLRAFDIAFNRVPTASFQQAVSRLGMPQVSDLRSVGKVTTMNVVFCRDLVGEKASPGCYERLPPAPSADKILKTMMILESYGLNDVAIDVARCYDDLLAPHIDIEHAVRLLGNPDCRLDDPLTRMEKSISWRITAPLRAARRYFLGGP